MIEMFGVIGRVVLLLLLASSRSRCFGLDQKGLPDLDLHVLQGWRPPSWVLIYHQVLKNVLQVSGTRIDLNLYKENNYLTVSL